MGCPYLNSERWLILPDSAEHLDCIIFPGENLRVR